MGDRMLEWACARPSSSAASETLFVSQISQGNPPKNSKGNGRWCVVAVATELRVTARCGRVYVAELCDASTRYSTADMCDECAAAVGAHKRTTKASLKARSGRA